jgi:UDP-2-acetamido-2-deoxy-ribo-hexuluronate aminotransferase
VRIGLNSRLDTLQAAVLQVKFKAFKEYELERINQAATVYTERLKGLVKTPVLPEGYYSSWAQYTIQLENIKQRDKLKEDLKKEGIPSMIYYKKPMHRQGAFAGMEFDEADFLVCNQLCDTVLSLPMHPYLTEDDQHRVSEVVRRSVEG